MRFHQLSRKVGIFLRHGFHNFFVFFSRMLCRILRLVHQGDEGATRNQFAQYLCQYGIAHQFCNAHMEIAQQLCSAPNIFV